MNPIFSVGIYVIWQLIVMALIGWCIEPRKLVRRSKKRRGALCFAAIVYIVLSLLPVMGAFIPDSPVKFRLQAAGNIWLGFVIYFNNFLLILCLILEIVRLISRRTGKGIPHLTALVISLAGGLILLGYGMKHAQDTVVTEFDITMEKSAGEYSDLDVVLIGDLHLSVNSHLSTIERMVELINEQDADAVVIAGDIFTSSYGGLKDPDKYAAVLRGIQSKYGVYAVYGNHDVEETLFGGFPISPISEAFRTKEMEQFFEECNFTVLYDETVSIADGNVQITGRIDGEKAGDGTTNRKSPEEVLKDTDPEKPVLVLQHEPVEFAELKKYGADLALCGHTHAGQIFPGNLIVPFFFVNAYGYKEVGGLDTIVTSGVGYYGPPMRVGTDSEVAVVHLHFKKG